MHNSPMQDPSCPDHDLDSLKCLLLDLARQRSVEDLLPLIVTRLCDLNGAALARIWTINPGDICETCPMRQECPDQTRCLHLVASAGRSLDGTEDWSGLNGRYRRFPLGVRKVGRIAVTGEQLEMTILKPDGEWIADPQWAVREHIRGIIGHPLSFQQENLGVLFVFLRQPPSEEAVTWLRMIADHAGAAIANARAFEQIEHLRSQLELENEYLRDEVKAATGSPGGVIGQSPGLRKILEQVALVAATEATVLITGESGVGKELIARAIHEQSPRSRGPMIKVNCASIPRDLFESEFFGHIEGAFTGAVRDRMGRFELADGGTLFLDEVGEIPLEMQSKLLRVLQEGTYERIGEEQTRHADVRIIAATNRDLQQEVETKRFRQDLYYRLSVFPIDVIPLRQRKEDIPELAATFLETQSRKLGLSVPPLKKKHIRDLQTYDWPGNVRELQNVIERAVIRARTGPLHFDLPTTAATVSPVDVDSANESREPLTDREIKQLERSNLQAVLELTGGKIYGTGGAAEYLGVHPATLSSRLKALEIKRPSH
ncbi:sigma-54-dependent Fis family transcriptional regulator [Symmachiella dynata]|uniref:sigma-54-dependent Fis family transcriptional regulator n=1 Tax=Symmachiella dynata TaxID=2527995 RepID=UPI0030EE3A1D